MYYLFLNVVPINKYYINKSQRCYYVQNEDAQANL